MKSFDSPLSQAKLKSLNKLKQKKYRYINQSYLCEGWRLFSAASELNPKDILEIIVNDNFKIRSNFSEVLNFCSHSDVPIFSCDEKIFKSISDEQSPSGIMFVMKLEYFQDSDISQISDRNCVYLENISDPGNLGTIIRTASWFGFNNIILSRDSVDPFNAKVVRASAGGIFNIKLYLDTELGTVLEFGKTKNYNIIGTILEKGEELSDWKVSDKNIIFFGNEANGLTDSAKQSLNKKITVPGAGKMESLNLSITAGIVLYHLYQKLK